MLTRFLIFVLAFSFMPILYASAEPARAAHDATAIAPTKPEKIEEIDLLRAQNAQLKAAELSTRIEGAKRDLADLQKQIAEAETAIQRKYKLADGDKIDPSTMTITRAKPSKDNPPMLSTLSGHTMPSPVAVPERSKQPPSIAVSSTNQTGGVTAANVTQ